MCCIIALLAQGQGWLHPSGPGANPKPLPALDPPWEAQGKLRHREVAEAKVSCSERTQASWLQAQIHAQLHKDGTKETPKGCKPPPRFPPALAKLLGP